MPQRLITGSDCCPCPCSDTVTFVTQVVGGQVLEGQGDPTTAPANPLVPATYFDKATGNQWGWDTSLQVWIPLATGVGANQQIYHYQGDVSAFPVPDNPNLPAINYDDSQGGYMSLWDTAQQAWY